MMHRALLLPEVVAPILQAGQAEPGFLYNSLLVSQLFFAEASRRLWSTCDSFEGAGQTHPDIPHLGEMMLKDDVGPQRAQLYANLVRKLSFRYEKDSYVDQTSWHSVLLQLQFPKLDSVCFWETDHAAALNTEDVILHYAQSRLRTLDVDVCGVLSHHFFEVLAGLCSKLQYLTLHPTEVTAPTDSVVRLLERMVNIESLDLGKGFKRVLSPGLLGAIASRPNLKQLVLPDIQDDCLIGLHADARRGLFPKLKYLYIGAAATSLELIHPIVPGLEAMGLSNEDLGRTNDVLAVSSRFRQLKSFTVQLNASSSVHGTELLQLAQGCPGLEELKIGIDSWCEAVPSATGITDHIIRTLASKLPKLRQLFLLFSSDTRPGVIETLRILGRCCTKLEELAFSCRADWQAVAALPQGTPLLANLEQLQLLPNEHMEQCMTREEHNRLMDVWQRNATTWLPRMNFMIIHHADAWEEEFINVLCPREENDDDLNDTDDSDGEVALNTSTEGVDTGNVSEG